VGGPVSVVGCTKCMAPVSQNTVFVVKYDVHQSYAHLSNKPSAELHGQVCVWYGSGQARPFYKSIHAIGYYR
jgi:hypothetical protein